MKKIFQAKHFLLTAANLSPETPNPDFFLSRLKTFKFFGDIKSAVISKEIHESGNPHMHALISFEKRKAIYKKDYFDFLFEKPTDVRTCHSPRQGASYVAKQGDFAQLGVPLVVQKKKDNEPRDLIIDFLKEKNRTLTDLSLISSKSVDRQLYSDSYKVDR